MNTKTSSNADQALTASGINDAGGDNAGLGQPDCPHCGGLGYVIPDVAPIHPSFGRAQTCVCRSSQEEMKRLNALQQLSQLGLLSECTFDTFLPEGHGLTAEKQRNLKIAYDTTLEYAQQPTGWLLLKGGYGCGKTHLAAAIANHRLNMGHSVLFVNTPDLLDHLRASFSPAVVGSYDERFEQVRNSPLLILDDLGSQSNTDWAQEKLYQIFNHRYNAKLPTVITTNEELKH
jgi:DNA replication protein DnaC